MPLAQPGDLRLLVRAYVSALDYMQQPAQRGLSLESTSVSLRSILHRAEAWLCERRIPPHAWCAFRIDGIVRYGHRPSLRAVYDPDRAEKLRGHFQRWVTGRFGPRRHSRAHVELLADWERLAERLIVDSSPTSVDVQALMIELFPPPRTWEHRVREARLASEIETIELRRRAAKGEWVW